MSNAAAWSLEEFGMARGRGFLPAEDPISTKGLVGAALLPYEALAEELPGRLSNGNIRVGFS